MNFLYALPLVAAVVSMPFVHSLWKEYNRERELKQMEVDLPVALTRVAALPPSVSFTSSLSLLSTGKKGLAREFATVVKKIQHGMPPQVAIESIDFGNSLPLRQAKRLFVKLYENGFTAAPALSGFARQLEEVQEVNREVDAANSMQKYSLLLSSALLVPLILALLYSISLNASSLLSAISNSTAGVQNAVFLSVNIYLALFCLLVSFFLAEQASKPRSFVTYFFSTAPVALLVFHVVLFAASNVF